MLPTLQHRGGEHKMFLQSIDEWSGEFLVHRVFLSDQNEPIVIENSNYKYTQELY